jgi:hypothetical protein
MNNHLYHSHDELMVRYEMQEVERAAAQARLLREAGLDGPGWLKRAMNGLGNLLKSLTKALKDQHSMEPKPLPRKSPRSAYRF